MGDYGDRYIVDEEYRNSMSADTNEFRVWLNAPLDGGVNQGMGIGRLRNPRTKECEFMMFYSSKAPSKARDPWDDIINQEDGVVHYWGDAKAGDGPDPQTSTGNGWVKDEYCRTYAKNNRGDAPPVLLFQKEQEGYVTFKGVCIISGLNLARHKDGNETVVNYRIDLDILNADSVSLEWIHRKSRTGVDAGGPEAWNHWVETGTVRRYSVYNKRVRSPDDQQPKGDLLELHSDIRSRLDNPKKGEKLEILLEKALTTVESISDVERTPRSVDKGVDLTGKVDLLSDVNLGGRNTKIDFKSQVKNKKK